MPNLLIRDVPEDTVKALKEIAKRNGRSLQKELQRFLINLAQGSVDPMEAADRIRRGLAAEYGMFPDSTALIRADRDR